MSRARSPRTKPLIERAVTDENFAHCVAMLGPISAWAGSITEGQKLTWNDRNCVQIAVEVALAFARSAAERDPVMAEAWRDVARIREAFRAAATGQGDMLGGAP